MDEMLNYSSTVIDLLLLLGPTPRHHDHRLEALSRYQPTVQRSGSLYLHIQVLLSQHTFEFMGHSEALLSSQRLTVCFNVSSWSWP